MNGKHHTGAVLVLILAVLLTLAGCGSANQESYSQEIREINEELAARIAGLGEKAAESGRYVQEGHGRDAAEVLAEMALILEGGVQELSQVRVPAGGEAAHASLLELLSGTAERCREVSSALSPAPEEERSSGGEETGSGEAGRPEGH